MIFPHHFNVVWLFEIVREKIKKGKRFVRLQKMLEFSQSNIPMIIWWDFLESVLDGRFFWGKRRS